MQKKVLNLNTHIMKFFTVLFLFCLSFSGIAQNLVCFTYDNAGNRIQRANCLPTALANNSQSEKHVLDRGETSGLFSVSVFPTPTAGLFKITVTGKQTSSVRIFNQNGQIIIDQPLSFDLSDFPSGLYVVWVKAESGEAQTKIVTLKQL